MAGYECQRLHGLQKKMNMVEGVVVNVDQQMNKKRRKKFYVISDYKKPDESAKRDRLHI